MSDDDALLARLRQLSLVDVDALLVGAPAARYPELCAAYADDLRDALAVTRERMKQLAERAARGPDPLGLLDLPPELRAREGAPAAAARAAAELHARAEARRALARLEDAAAMLLARLVEADRRQPR